MYQFTTETIINSNLDSNGVTPKFSFDDTKNVLTVLRVGTYKATEVLSCYKHEYVAPVKEKLVKTVVTVPDASKVYRLTLKLKRLDSARSEFSNDLSYNAIARFHEVTGVSTAADLVAAFVKSINKEVKLKDNSYVTASNVAAALTLDIADEYTHFSEVLIEEYVGNSLTGYDSYKVVENVLTTGVLTAGKEGFGTVKQITKNMRLPTLANTNWTALNQEERPVAGGQYSQYSIRLKTDRGPIGTDAVGDFVQSITTHVFYVLSTLVTAWEDALTQAGIQIKTASTDET